ncbi:hypothetical protein N7537_012075 [Penicillium hordei]|uniref:Carboxylic ester hydrolase n=1 Tax=Penicillium hordei TaxID=40994 RepID=A0AAD6GU59_9EURO|nr:uncharacterized protein N7537_012075 [Penicillium hordei]KAJ5589397.1 hypothetical protein N7537_012075 [Penicillium hordei]
MIPFVRPCILASHTTLVTTSLEIGTVSSWCPGAAHRVSNSAQPNGPFPQANLQVMTRYVEQGIIPHTLNTTVLQGDNKGINDQLRAWPLRPYWKGSGKSLACE